MMNEPLGTVPVDLMPQASMRSQGSAASVSLLSGHTPLFAEELFVQGYQQKVFRALMEASSRPGRIMSVPGGHFALHSILLSLVDVQVRFSDPCQLLTRDMHRQLESHLTPPERADFIAAWGLDDPAQCVRNPRIGTLESPELSATLILEIGDIRTFASDGESSLPADTGLQISKATNPVDTAEHSHALLLSGPGIACPHVVHLTGLHSGWLALRDACNASFPMGLDFILTAGSRFIALPRTTRITGAH